MNFLNSLFLKSDVVKLRSNAIIIEFSDNIYNLFLIKLHGCELHIRYLKISMTNFEKLPKNE